MLVFLARTMLLPCTVKSLDLTTSIIILLLLLLEMWQNSSTARTDTEFFSALYKFSLISSWPYPKLISLLMADGLWMVCMLLRMQSFLSANREAKSFLAFCKSSTHSFSWFSTSHWSCAFFLAQCSMWRTCPGRRSPRTESWTTFSRSAKISEAAIVLPSLLWAVGVGLL